MPSTMATIHYWPERLSREDPEIPSSGKKEESKLATKSRTFKVKQPRMRGDDVATWQKTIKALFKDTGINCPIKIDGVYGVGTRSYTAALLRAYGVTTNKMVDGITPELRIKMRNKDFTAGEKKLRDSAARVQYRRDLRERYARASEIKIHRIVARVFQDDWGFHPGVHDGLDVITPANAVIFAPVKCRVIDVRSSGWWGKGAPANASTRSKGDGIIQLRVLETVGPFKAGMHIGFGHAEKAMVRVGQTVKAGTPIGHVGYANLWHIHLMLNNGGTGKGIGTINPRPCFDYAQKHG